MNLICDSTKKKARYGVATIPNCACPGDDFHWGYKGEEGPGNWRSYYPLCGGSSQSPINLESAVATKLTLDELLSLFVKPQPETEAITEAVVGTTPFIFTGYDEVPSEMTLLNNGHSAQVTIVPSRNMPTLTGGGLPGTYEFLQYHFHWGSDSTQGSEHLIDGKSFPMEIHFVHWNTAYGSVGDALNKADGLAVLGYMFEVSSQDNAAFDNLINQFDDVEEAGTEVGLTTAQALSSYMGAADTSSFYRYNGSLTTPTCNESVVWTVFRDTIPISEDQLVEFRTKLFDEKSNLIVDNFRPVQPLNGRLLQLITV